MGQQAFSTCVGGVTSQDAHIAQHSSRRFVVELEWPTKNVFERRLTSLDVSRQLAILIRHDGKVMHERVVFLRPFDVRLECAPMLPEIGVHPRQHLQ